MGGFFGAALNHSCRNDLFYGVDYNSHLGTRRAGMVTYDADDNRFCRSIHSIENTYFRSKFEDELNKFKGDLGIGVISDNDPQPIVINSHLGKFAVVTVAKINNIDQLEKELLEQGAHFGELSSGKTNPTELVALLINEGQTFEEGITNLFKRIEGSCSLLILTETSIIAARDQLGRTPVILGEKIDGSGFAATSESTAFPNLGYRHLRDLGPGEVVKFDSKEIKVLIQPGKDMQICSFLWVYYGFPTSSYEGTNVEEMRFKSGYKMGKTDESMVDCASGIPDSGVGMALGYAAGKGVPYLRCISKYTPTWPRSFTPSEQERRNLVAKMKLVANEKMLKDKKAIFCDDSIVRGTQLKDNVSDLYELGAKEVHIRIACPPLIYGCPFIGFTSSKSDMELITRRIINEFEGDPNKNLEEYATTGSERYNKLVDKIKDTFGLTSLKFNPIETLVESIGLPKEKICTHCFDGSSRFHPCENCCCKKQDKD
ncbi:MAG: amidophosphoribosyltransferase [Muribaculaceae bacterium]|nr:amidophosphoribosyltransferase [Muribaculaceae bacterium]